MYKKKLLILLILLLTPITFAALAAEKYITDELPVYLRRGPGTEYGLVGSLKSGDKVSVLETSGDGRYARIKDNRDRIAWLEVDLLTNTPSLKERIPNLEAQIGQLEQQTGDNDQSKQQLINDYIDKLAIANNTITSLQASNDELQSQVSTQQTDIKSLSNKVDMNRQSLMLTWFLYGGLVAGIGLVLGILLPFIMPKRRKKDGWKN